jgi:putative PIN family toxin of toxin-antitoxin system
MDTAGPPHQALPKARATDLLAMSQAVFDEVFDVLHRPRLARFVDETLRAELLDQLVSGTFWFEPSIAITDCRDSSDDKYLELALAAKANTIVSSDQDLLVLHPWRGVTILRPAVYLAQLPPEGKQ